MVNCNENYTWGCVGMTTAVLPEPILATAAGSVSRSGTEGGPFDKLMEQYGSGSLSIDSGPVCLSSPIEGGPTWMINATTDDTVPLPRVDHLMKYWQCTATCQQSLKAVLFG